MVNVKKSRMKKFMKGISICFVGLCLCLGHNLSRMMAMIMIIHRDHHLWLSLWWSHKSKMSIASKVPLEINKDVIWLFFCFTRSNQMSNAGDKAIVCLTFSWSKPDSVCVCVLRLMMLIKSTHQPPRRTNKQLTNSTTRSNIINLS